MDNINVVTDFGADTAAADNLLAFQNARVAAKAAKTGLIIPPGVFEMSGPWALEGGDVILGAHKYTTELRWSAPGGGIVINTNAEERRIVLDNLTFALGTAPTNNAETGLFASGVTYCEFTNLRSKFFRTGIYMRREPTHNTPCWFNGVEKFDAYVAKYGVDVADTGTTVNNCWFEKVRIEDVGQFSGGVGLRISGVGHAVKKLYAGLPGGHAALETLPATQNCSFEDIYAESTLAYGIYDDATISRRNIFKNLHIDSSINPIPIRTRVGTKSTFENVGPFPQNPSLATIKRIVVNRTLAALAPGASRQDFFPVPGAAIGDAFTISLPPTWDPAIVTSQPVAAADGFYIGFTNTAASPRSLGASDYYVTWVDLT